MGNKKNMTPKEKGRFLLKYFKDERGDLDLNNVDLSDFEGNVWLSEWKVKKDLHQSQDVVGGDLYLKQMTPKEKGQFLIKYFRNEEGGLDLNNVDLSDFKGDVDISGWKVGGNLFLDQQEVKGDLYQCNQRVGRILYQDDGSKLVEPDYKALYKKMQKEFCEVYRQKEALLWALAKAMEASK